MMNRAAQYLRRWLRSGRLLVVALVVTGAIIAIAIYIGGFSVPLFMRADGQYRFHERLEQLARQRYQTALESYRQSTDPKSGLIQLEVELAEIVNMWPQTLTAVKSSQMLVAASRRQSETGKLTAASSQALREFLKEALARPGLYFTNPVSYTSSTLAAEAISSLRSEHNEGEAWSVCRCVRWQIRDIKPIAEVCEELWQELSLPGKFWLSISKPAPSKNEHVYATAIKNPNVIIRILKYRINPYRGKNMQKLADALYAAGELRVAESVKSELLKIDFMRTAKLESKWSELSGKKYPKFRFPNWGENSNDGR